MKIGRTRIQNYKGFNDSGWIDFSDGVTVVVGENSSGKSALLEAFRFGRLENIPHRTAKRAPGEPFPDMSTFSFEVSMPGEALKRVALERGGQLRINVVAEDTPTAKQELATYFQTQLNLRLQAVGKNQAFTSLDNPPHGQFQQYIKMRSVIAHPNTERSDLENYSIGRPGEPSDHTTALAWILAQRSVYVFDAERFRIGRYVLDNSQTLLPNAQNLPNILLKLNKNTKKFAEYKNIICSIFPKINDISVSNVGTNEIEIYLYNNNTDRDDLAIPLNQCGTGIAQALAIVYVVMMYSNAVIVIDEPNSFLHPGASKKLMHLLRQFPMHQLIVSTHSPEIISSLSPDRLLIVQWNSDLRESQIEPVDHETYDGTRAILGELGASLSDVFGSDAVIWVEGPTEQACFPLFLNAHPTISMTGAAFVPMREASAFDHKRRNPKELFDIYERGASGSALLPPEVRYSFDREQRSPKEVEDLERASNNRAKFLPRRMYENYLLHAEALSTLLNEIDEKAAVTPDQVQNWLDEHFREIRDRSNPEAEVERTCDAACLLYQLFSELTEQRTIYRKTTHSPKLTSWLLKSDAKHLEELINYVCTLVPESCRISRLH